MKKGPSLFDAKAVARGEALGLMARRIVEGFRVGEHRSPLSGFAIEFAQHREYAPGDDPRHLDWKVLGRTDRLYIKQYEQDTNFSARLIIDSSESMGFGSTGTTKLEYAKLLGATLAYIILLQADAATVTLFDSELRDPAKPTDSRNRLMELMRRIAQVEAGGTTRVGPALRDAAMLMKSRGIIVLISDLLDEDGSKLARDLQAATLRGGEVIVFHVLDPQELTFPFQGTHRFEGLEGEPEIKLNASDVRADYLDAVERFMEQTRKACESARSHYVLADISKPVADTLTSYLAFRHRT